MDLVIDFSVGIGVMAAAFGVFLIVAGIGGIIVAAVNKVINGHKRVRRTVNVLLGSAVALVLIAYFTVIGNSALHPLVK